MPNQLPDVATAQDYYPFGMLQPNRQYTANSTTYRYGFNGQEKSAEIDPNGNLNTAEFWEYDTRIGRRWNVDPKPTVGLSEYSVFNNNPILFNDVLGDDWFKYQAQGEKKSSWHYQNGHVALFIDKNGKERTNKNGYEYLAKFVSKTNGETKEKMGEIILYKQDKIVAEGSVAFSGGVPNKDGTYHQGIEAGDYFMNLGYRRITNTVEIVQTPHDDLEPRSFFGLEVFPPNGKMLYQGRLYPDNTTVTNAYGNARIRLIPASELGNNVTDRGLYLHGKHLPLMITHGCLCDKTEAIQNYFIYKAKDFKGKVPVSVTN